MTTKTDTEQERAELLPCPFCGESKNLTVQHHEGTIIHPAYRIYCGNCGASSGYADRVDPAKYWNSRAALQSQDREDAERRQIADLVLHHAEGMQVSSPLESRQGFGEDTEHYFQISDGKIRYGVIITITRLTDVDHARHIEGDGE